MNRLKEYRKKIKADKKERNRFLMVLVAFLFFMDYMMFCYHAEKNPFDIFPSFPIKDNKKLVDIYLPDLDGKSLIKETRHIQAIESIEGYIQMLYMKVIEGSEYENTSVVVPVDTYIRKVWIYNNFCVIDAGTSLLKTDISVIPGSQDTFKKALTKTILENVPSVKRVVLLDRGIPGRNLWEF